VRLLWELQVVMTMTKMLFIGLVILKKRKKLWAEKH
jgi:hypothetical protein